MSFLALLRSEAIKYRRSTMLLLVLGAPTVLAILQFINLTLRRGFYEQQNQWSWLTLQRNAFALWGLFLLPLLVVVLATLAARLEHDNESWQYLLALPVSWGQVYLAKLLVVLAFVQLSGLVLVAELVVEGILLGIPGQIPIGSLLLFSVYGLPAAWAIMAIHFWLAVQYPSFAVSVGLGVVGIVIAIAATGSNYGRFVPWAFPIFIYNATFEAVRSSVLGISMVTGLGASLLGLVHFARSNAPGTG